jgi:hypothetical protein
MLGISSNTLKIAGNVSLTSSNDQIYENGLKTINW